MKKMFTKWTALALVLVSLFALPSLAGAVDTEASIQFRTGKLTLVVPGPDDADRRTDLDFGINDLPMDTDDVFPVVASSGQKPFGIYVEDTRNNEASGWRLQAALSDFSVTVEGEDGPVEHTFPSTIYFTGTEAEGMYQLTPEEIAELVLSESFALLSESHSGLGAEAGELQYVNVAAASDAVRRNMFYLRWDVPDGPATIDMQIDPMFDLRSLVTEQKYVATINWTLNEQMNSRL